MATPLRMDYLLSMHLRLCLLAFVAMILPACSKQTSTPPAPAPAVAAAAETPLPRPTTPPPAQPLTIAATDSSAILAQLTQAVRRFSAERRKVPLTLDELTAAGYLKAIPAAPAGKRFVINPKNLTVTIE